MDTVLLSRWQFAITTIYHFFFIPVTLGLSVFIAVLETYYVRSGNKQARSLVRFLGTLFLINFAMGVVTGIVQEFHFGMNWSEYSRFMGDIFGAPLALEALTAFFLESTFLGIWMFGWDRLSPKLHCISIWIVAFASNLSAFWILVANSFMQHPVGFALRNGRAEMTDFFALLTNPYVFGQYAHTFFSGIVTSGVLIAAVSAYKLLKQGSSEKFLLSLKLSLVYGLVGLFAVMGTGHLQMQYIAKVQPMKLASVEALWETQNPAPFAIAASIDTDQQKNSWEIEVPSVLSFLVYNEPKGEIKGIRELQQISQKQYGGDSYVPDVTGLFWSFRLMILTGIVTILVLLGAGFALFKNKLFACPILLKLLVWIIPLPFLSNSFGWYVTEGGRQPWIVVGLQKVSSAVSLNITSAEVWFTMIGFTLIYLVLAIAAVSLFVKFVKKEPAEALEGGKR